MEHSSVVDYCHQLLRCDSAFPDWARFVAWAAEQEHHAPGHPLWRPEPLHDRGAPWRAPFLPEPRTLRVSDVTEYDADQAAWRKANAEHAGARARRDAGSDDPQEAQRLGKACGAAKKARQQQHKRLVDKWFGTNANQDSRVFVNRCGFGYRMVAQNSNADRVYYGALRGSAYRLCNLEETQKLVDEVRLVRDRPCGDRPPNSTQFAGHFFSCSD